MGFCLFNNVAVAARARARRATALERVLILDWDVHHGNGTNDIFHADRRRCCSSRSTSRRCIRGPARRPTTGSGPGDGLHGQPAGAGGLGRRGVVLARRARRRCRWRARTRRSCPRRRAGFDAHADDPLAGCEVTDDGLRDDGRRRRAALAEALGVPVGHRARGRLRPRRARALDARVLEVLGAPERRGAGARACTRGERGGVAAGGALAGAGRRLRLLCRSSPASWRRRRRVVADGTVVVVGGGGRGRRRRRRRRRGRLGCDGGARRRARRAVLSFGQRDERDRERRRRRAARRRRATTTAGASSASARGACGRRRRSPGTSPGRARRGAPQRGQRIVPFGSGTRRAARGSRVRGFDDLGSACCRGGLAAARAAPPVRPGPAGSSSRWPRRRSARRPTTSPTARGPLSARPQDGQKRASLPCSAPQRGHAAMPGSRSSLIGRGVVEQRPPARAARRRRACSAAELAAHELVVGPVEAVQVEDEAAEVAEAELAHAAQVAQAAAQPAAVAEARATLSWRGRRPPTGVVEPSVRTAPSGGAGVGCVQAGPS